MSLESDWKIGYIDVYGVQRYDMETAEWSMIRDLPHGVCCKTAKAIVCNERVTVVTRKRVIKYQPETDNWTMKTFNEVENVPVISEQENNCALESGDLPRVRTQS